MDKVLNIAMHSKLLLKSWLFYFGVLLLVVGIGIVSVSENAGLLGACLAQGGIIVCFLAYRRVRTINDPRSPIDTSQRQKRQRSLFIVCTLVCVCFMLSPVVLWPEISGV